jgi:CheY-like chemotaxis protein
MPLRCLLLSQDDRAVRLLRLLLDDLFIQVDHCTELLTAQEQLWQQKFDGVIADCELKGGAELIRTMRKSKHNQRSIAFAVTGNEIKMGTAFEIGAHFVIHKPLITERVKRTLNAAHGLMMREKRLHFRHPAQAPVKLRLGHDRVLSGSLCDLSQHGALIDCGSVLKKNLPVRLSFTLPDTSFAMEISGRVTWAHPSGRAGVLFESLADDARARLLQWAVQRSIEVPQTPSVPATANAVSSPPVLAHEVELAMDFQVEVIEPSTQEELEARQRATLRGAHHATVKILGFEGGAPVVIQGTCENLSELGLAATLDENLAVGESVLLQVQLPGVQNPVVLHAKVRHHEDDRCGFEFVGVDQTFKELLRECVIELPVE